LIVKILKVLRFLGLNMSREKLFGKGAPMSKLFLPIPPPELRGNSRAHFHVKSKAAKFMKSSVVGQIEQGRFVGYSVLFRFPDKRRRDCDNFLIGLKPALDEVSEIIGQDDSEWQIYGVFKDVDKFKAGVVLEFHEQAPFNFSAMFGKGAE
jgi:crossover junction endodeoxyribonuclease RusA